MGLESNVKKQIFTVDSLTADLEPVKPLEDGGDVGERSCGPVGAPK